MKSTKWKLQATITWISKIMISVYWIHKSVYFDNNDDNTNDNNNVSLISAYQWWTTLTQSLLYCQAVTQKNCCRINHDCIWNAEQASHFKAGTSFQTTVDSIAKIPLQISSEISWDLTYQTTAVSGQSSHLRCFFNYLIIRFFIYYIIH